MNWMNTEMADTPPPEVPPPAQPSTPPIIDPAPSPATPEELPQPDPSPPPRQAPPPTASERIEALPGNCVRLGAFYRARRSVW